MTSKPMINEMRMKPIFKRKPGGQPGNLNAFKHGMYSRRYKALEIADLSAVLQNNLEDEIMLLRIIMRRVFTYADQDADTLEAWENVLAGPGIRGVHSSLFFPRRCARRSSARHMAQRAGHQHRVVHLFYYIKQNTNFSPQIQPVKTGTFFKSKCISKEMHIDTPNEGYPNLTTPNCHRI